MSLVEMKLTDLQKTKGTGKGVGALAPTALQDTAR